MSEQSAIRQFCSLLLWMLLSLVLLLLLLLLLLLCPDECSWLELAKTLCTHNALLRPGRTSCLNTGKAKKIQPNLGVRSHDIKCLWSKTIIWPKLWPIDMRNFELDNCLVIIMSKRLTDLQQDAVPIVAQGGRWCQRTRDRTRLSTRGEPGVDLPADLHEQNCSSTLRRRIKNLRCALLLGIDNNVLWRANSKPDFKSLL